MITLGISIGLLLGLTGAGGGILAVPAVMFGLGLNLPQATPIALIAVGIAALVGSLHALRQGHVRYKAALVMACAGGITAPIGLWIGQRVQPYWLHIAFSLILLWVAWRMWRSSTSQTSSRQFHHLDTPKRCMLSPTTGKFVWNRTTAVTLASIGGIAGLFTGLLGVGGGFIIVPALRHFTSATMQHIVPTSLMVIALVSFSAVTAALTSGIHVSTQAWLFIAGTIIGIIVGRMAATAFPASLGQRLFAVVCVLVAAVLVIH